MSSEENTTLVNRWFTAFEEERWDEFPEILAADVVGHENGEVMHGLEEILGFEKDFKESNPEAEIVGEEMVASGNTVFSRGVAPGGGTHLLCAHIEDGNVAEYWVLTE